MDAETTNATSAIDQPRKRPDWRRIALASFALGFGITGFYGVFDLSGAGDHVWGVIALGLAAILFGLVHYLQP